MVLTMVCYDKGGLLNNFDQKAKLGNSGLVSVFDLATQVFICPNNRNHATVTQQYEYDLCNIAALWH